MSPSNSITTRKGDHGISQLFSGEQAPKYDDRLQAIGDLDELNSLLGVARHQASRPGVGEAMLELQRDLFVICSEIATTGEKVEQLTARVDDAMLAAMDERRDALEARIELPAGFVIPGGTPSSAPIDVARAVSRRCERRAVLLRDKGELENERILVWLNRLSDYLWLLAREEEGPNALLKDS